MSKESSGPGFMAGLFVGGLIGTAVGLLLAPKSGKETRRSFREQGFILPANFDDFIETAKGATTELADNVFQAVEEKKAQIHEAIAHGKAVASETKEVLEREFAERTANNEPGVSGKA